MADTLTHTIRASINWTFREALDLSNVNDAATLEYSKDCADGTSADQCDKIWHDQRVITTGANDDLDLTALTNSIFGSTVTINFVKVKSILIVNTSTTAGDELKLDSSVTNGFLGPFNGSNTSKIEIGPDSACLLSSKKDGWAVTAGTGDILRINNPNAGSVTYKIVIVGTSA